MNPVGTKYGSITLVTSLRGVAFMVDTRHEMTEENWDHALTRAYELGYELDPLADVREMGVWEIHDLIRLDETA